MSVLQISNLTG